MQEVEELHVRIVVRGEDSVRTERHRLPVRLIGCCNMARAMVLDAEERVREEAVLMPFDESVELLSPRCIVVWRHVCSNVLDKERVSLTAVWQEGQCA
jgi:hypothetical protein